MGVNVTQRFIETLAPTLSERDLEIIQAVGRFKVMTGDQLERLFFADGSERSRARNRQAVLRRLVGRRVLARVGTRRVGGQRGGSASFVYRLDVAGQRLAAVTSARPRRPHVHYGPAVPHTLAVAELFVRLVEAERAGQLALLAFDAEPYCWRQFGSQILKPDAFVQLGVEVGGVRRKAGYFVEVDRAEEWGARISSKLPLYESYRVFELPSGRMVPRVVFLAPHVRRVAYLERLVSGRAARPSSFLVGLFDDVLEVLALPSQPKPG